MHSGEEQIGVTVIVIVTHGDTDVEAMPSQTGRLSYVGKHPVSIVAKEAIGILRGGLLHGRELGAIGKEDVWTAVPVVVEYCDAPAIVSGIFLDWLSLLSR